MLIGVTALEIVGLSFAASDRGQMPIWLHPLMEHADDLDQTRRHHAKVEHMNWAPYRSAGVTSAGMAEVTAAHAGPQLRSVSRRRPVRLGGHLAHCRGEEGSVTAPTFGTPLSPACS
jgi:hypothetical protein